MSRPRGSRSGIKLALCSNGCAHEWLRTGLPLRLANDACDVLNAATRKYLTADHLWYYPPPEAFVKLAEYANRLGKPEGRPYFSVDGKRPVPGEEWGKMRAKFQCPIGITNVWKEPQVNGAERIQGERSGMRYKFSSLHGSQKSLRFTDLIVRCCTDQSDVVSGTVRWIVPGRSGVVPSRQEIFRGGNRRRVLPRCDRKAGLRMTPNHARSEPQREPPDPTWEHLALYHSVREAIATLPVYFRTETHISGIMATDLHTLNSVLGATIEEQVVRTLNLIRTTWDPNGHYALFSFVRQPQTFPDVRLRKATGDETLMGVELKGWYLLAKEGEPSLRFQATAAACTRQDLIVVVPLGAQQRHQRLAHPVRAVYRVRPVRGGIPKLPLATRPQDNPGLHDRPAGQHQPYPSKADQILDKPRFDSGGNFGRLARAGMMDSYMAKLNEVSLCGIKTVFWREFLKAFQEPHDRRTGPQSAGPSTGAGSASRRDSLCKSAGGLYDHRRTRKTAGLTAVTCRAERNVAVGCRRSGFFELQRFCTQFERLRYFSAFGVSYT